MAKSPRLRVDDSVAEKLADYHRYGFSSPSAMVARCVMDYIEKAENGEATVAAQFEDLRAQIAELREQMEELPERWRIDAQSIYQDLNYIKEEGKVERAVVEPVEGPDEGQEIEISDIY